MTRPRVGFLLNIKQAVRVTSSTISWLWGPGFVQGERTGELSQTLSEGVDALDAYFSEYLPQLFLAALVPRHLPLCVSSGLAFSPALTGDSPSHSLPDASHDRRRIR